MEKRLQEALEGREDNYILPFFWQHGETEASLRKMMNAISNSGVRAVCMESRPHPDFVGERWWRDMDIVMEEAEARGMQVWVLDDAHFPSGCCNGKITDESPYVKRYLDHYSIDAQGPRIGSSFIVRLSKGERLLAVIAARRTSEQAGVFDMLIEIKQELRGNRIYWDVPEGYWNIAVIKETSKGSGRAHYINSIDAKSVKYFIDTVYEPHWQHYKEKFGKSFAGFFSDEPELGNCLGEYGHHAVIGTPDMRLPWCQELEQSLRGKWGISFGIHLLKLWHMCGSQTAEVRYEYMQLVTDLYGKNFCGQIGSWCEEHQVSYIGHVIEDCGTHARLGLGCGHYFKALWGQHMSGIDVVLQQIRPGYEHRDFYHIGGRGLYNGSFFHYGLARMGASLAQFDLKKKGRTMCEVYGAYGWSEGLKLMKWLSDHMLVRGVNWFVPHAFSGKAYPDPDCPPHFYAWGHHPQYPWFKKLMAYMNRMCHLMNGGESDNPTAILYTGEFDWTCAYTAFEEVGRLLAQRQFPYSVVPLGLLEIGRLEKGRLYVGATSFEELIIPDCKLIPRELATWVSKAEQAGFPVIFAGSEPDILESDWCEAEQFYGWRTQWEEMQGEKDAEPSSIPRLARYAGGSEEELLRLLESVCVRPIVCQAESPYLRVYHYCQSEGAYYMVFNEDPLNALDTWMRLEKETQCEDGDLCWYDAYDNDLKQAEQDKEGNIKLNLEPGEAKVLYVGKLAEGFRKKAVPGVRGRSMKLEEGWKVSYRRSGEREFGEKGEQKLCDIAGIAGKEHFCGVICYEKEFEWHPDSDGTRVKLNFGAVYESMELWLNGECVGDRLSEPYCCWSSQVREGKNHIKVLVANTPVNEQEDEFSMTMPVEPTGLLGPVCIKGFFE